MLTFTEFAAKSNGCQPQEGLTFPLNIGYIIVLCSLIIKNSGSVCLLESKANHYRHSCIMCIQGTIPYLKQICSTISTSQAKYATILKK